MEIKFPLAYRLRLIDRTALLRKMVNISSKKAQTRYKEKNDEDVRLEPRFVARDYVFVERPSLLASAAYRMSYGGYSKFLSHRTGPYRVISIRLMCAKIAQDGIRNTI